MLKASTLSTGGFGNVPSLHADLIPRGWADERAFVEALAVGQVSPGPNGLWVVSLGYFVAGLPGAILSTFAIALPPWVVLGVDRLYQRVRHHSAVEGFVRGLGLAVVGVFLTTLLRLLGAAGLDVRTLTIGTVAVFLGVSRKIPVAAIIVLGGVVGLVWRG